MGLIWPRGPYRPWPSRGSQEKGNRLRGSGELPEWKRGEWARGWAPGLRGAEARRGGCGQGPRGPRGQRNACQAILERLHKFRKVLQSLTRPCGLRRACKALRHHETFPSAIQPYGDFHYKVLEGLFRRYKKDFLGALRPFLRP